MNPDLLATARRKHLVFFLIKVFAELHPGKAPLETGWYLQALCHALETAARTPGARLAIAIPPRHTKSIAASVALCAWLLGHDPTMKIMVASYADKLAREHAQQFRQVVESQWYQRLFPAMCIAADENRMLDLKTTLGGGRRAVTVGGSVTGLGADLTILDDCLKADEVRSQARRDEVRAWFDGTLTPRLDRPGESAMISIAQRLHEDDLYAHVVAKGWDTLVLPSIAEKVEEVPIGFGRVHRREVDSLLGHPNYPRDVLDKLRRDLGPQVFSAQHQQNPVAPGGNMVRLEWFPSYGQPLDRSAYQSVVQSWDTASSDLATADWSVCLTLGYRERAWHLLDVYRQRVEYPELKRAVLRLNRQWRPDTVLIEDANSGKSLWPELRDGGELLPIMCKPEGSKEDRLNGITGQLEAGMCLLPDEAPWLDLFRSEIRAFPYGRHDDQADALSQAFNYIILRGRWLTQERDPRTGRPLRIERPNRIRRR